MNRPRPAFTAHRDRFAAASARHELARVERLVLSRRWTVRRSLKLDRALANYETKGAA